MSQETTTTIETTKTAPKDDFKLASEAQSLPETTEVVEAAAATEPAEPEVVEPAEIEEELEETEPLDTSKNEEPGKKKKGGFQRRVDKLTREKTELQRELEMARAKAAALEVQKPAAVDEKITAKTTPSSGEPRPEDFAEVKDYYKALAKFEFQQEQNAEKVKAREASVKAEMTKQRDTHLSRMKEFEKTHSDFNDVMENIRNVNAPQDIHTAIMNSDLGPALMYELAQKPEEFARIIAMNPVDGVRALGKMEAKLEAASAEKTNAPATETVPAKKVTSAPKPISTINSKAGHVASTRDNLPYDEWKKLREAEIRGR